MVQHTMTNHVSRFLRGVCVHFQCVSAYLGREVVRDVALRMNSKKGRDEEEKEGKGKEGIRRREWV